MPVAASRLTLGLAMALATAACSSPLITLGSTLAESLLPAASGDGDRGQLIAEVVEVDEVQRRIRVTTDDGRTGTVLYDTNTVVVHDQQHTTVKSLEAGAPVIIQVQNVDGHLYATRVDVREAEEDPEAEGTSNTNARTD